MRHKTYVGLSALIFLIVGLLHLYRAYNHLAFQFGDYHLATIWSWVAGVILLYLAYQGFRHRRR